jgi:hypothetical protein
MELRKKFLGAVDDLDDVGAGLTLDVENDRGRRVRPRGEARIFGGVHGVGDVGDADRRAIFIRDDHLPYSSADFNWSLASIVDASGRRSCPSPGSYWRWRSQCARRRASP